MQKALHHIQKQSFVILAAFALLSVVGVALIPRLSLQYLPQYQEPGFSVYVQWPGASPKAIEREVISLLEANFSLIQGIKRIYSKSAVGSGSVDLDVDPSADLDFLRYEISTKIRQIYPRLPDRASYPVIHDVDPDRALVDRPILTYSVSATQDVSTIYTYALDHISPKVGTLAGVYKVQVMGGQQQEYVVRLDEIRLRELNMGPSDISSALRQHFEESIIGVGNHAGHNYSLRLVNKLQSPDQEWENIPIKKINQQIIYLGDVAHITFQDQVANRYYRINGENSVRILVYPEKNTNHIDLAKNIKNAIANIKNTLPPNYHLVLDDDATEYLQSELRKIRSRTILSLGILMIFLLLIYRNVRYFIAILSALLVTIFVSSIFYYTFKVQLHLYALAAITVSFGIIMDNAIVLSHHLLRQKNINVFPALVASTLTTIASLVVVYFLPPRWQVDLLDFCKVLAINLSVSLLVAAIYIPALLTRFPTLLKQSSKTKNLGNYAVSKYQSLLGLLVRKKVWIIASVVLLFGTPVFLAPSKIDGWDWYNKSVGSDWFVENIRPTINRVLGGTLRLFSWYVYEGSSFRQPEETVLYVRASMPPGSTIDQMNAVCLQIEQYLRQFPVEIKKYVTNINSGDYGSMSIYFNEGYDYSFPFILKNRLISYSTNTGGVTWNVYGVGRGFSNASGGSPPRFTVSMFGYNQDILHEQAKTFAFLLLQHPRIQEVDIDANIDWYRKDRYAYNMEVDQKEMASNTIVAQDLYAAIQYYNHESSPDLYLPGNRAVRLVSDQLNHNDLWRWNNKVHQVDSNKFSFSAIGSITKESVAQALHKENQEYIRKVQFEYTGSHRFGSKYLDECLEQLDKMMPLGFRAERNEYSFSWGKEQQKQYGLIILIIGLIFFICSIHFESFRQALSVVVLIPLSFIGIFLIFYWFDGSFDQGGYTSFILLSGLVVNSLILIFNDYNSFRKNHTNITSMEAYRLALEHKFVPIVLTILSTAFGMVPFLMHGRQEVFWYALALGTIGGLMFSLILILLVMPVFIIKT